MYSQAKNSQAEEMIVEQMRRDNHESMEVFRETARIEHNDDRKRLCAHTLFSSFTAEIIKENTFFTR